jgi:hypothetical protein
MAEFRTTLGHLHHDTMMASVIIQAAFRDAGSRHARTSIRHFFATSRRADRTIATVVL